MTPWIKAVSAVVQVMLSQASLRIAGPEPPIFLARIVREVQITICDGYGV